MRGGALTSGSIAPRLALALGLTAALALGGCDRMKRWLTPPLEDSRPIIACATAPGEALDRQCRFERHDAGDGVSLILSRPDGGFRRLRVAADGSIVPADGAAEARIVREGGMTGIAIEGERYVVPHDLLGGHAAASAR